MNSPLRSGAASGNPPTARILVWDLPVRVFHWLLAACFAGAYLTGESAFWRPVHTTLGYTMAGLVLFRLAWGLVGTRYARFADFLRGPRTALAYLRTLLQGRPQRFTGHNPLGALAVLALLLLTLLVAASGWATLNERGSEWLEEVHEALANAMLGLVALHIAAVVISSRLHQERLVAAMIHGRKDGLPAAGITSHCLLVAVLLLLAVLAFWWLRLHQFP